MVDRVGRMAKEGARWEAEGPNTWRRGRGGAKARASDQPLVGLTRRATVVMRIAMVLLVLVSPMWARAEAGARDGQTLKIANRSIVELHAIAGYSAADRIAAVEARLERALERSSSPLVTLDDVENGTRILIDGEPIFMVTPADVDTQIGETPRIVAEEAKKRLERVLVDLAMQKSRPHLIRATTAAAIATLVYLIFLLLIRLTVRLIGRRLARGAEKGARKLRVKGVSLLDVSRALRFVRFLLILLSWGVGVVMTVTWLAFVLTQFPYTRPWGEELELNLITGAREGALSIARTLPDLAVVVVIIVIAVGIIRVAGWLFDRIEVGRIHVPWLEAEVVRPTRRLFNFAAWVFAIVMAYPYLPGSDTEAFKGLSVLIGLMASLGGSSIVGQIASGLTLMYARTVRVGDYVRIGESEGTVTEIGMIATRIRTGLGEELVLPSATVLGSVTKNYSRAFPGTGYVVDTTVTIGYATPWRQVHAMLLEAASRTPGVAGTPPPIVRQLALSDFNIEYRLAAYTPLEAPRARIEVLSELHANIQDTFNRYGVQIMSPHYLSDPPAPQVVPREEWFATPAGPGAEEDAPLADSGSGA